MDRLDLLVIGAGPTGLMMAAEAARYGLKCRIVDKNSEPATHSRALAIQPRTLEVLDHLGLIDDFLKEGQKIHSIHVSGQHETIGILSLDDLDSPYPFVLSLEQTKTEAILTQYLHSMGLEVERDVELNSFQQNSEGVEAALLHTATDKQEMVKASWLVGCDGAHSVVRKSLGMKFEGKAFPDVFSLADVRLHNYHLHDGVSLHFDPKGLLGIIPLPGKDRYRLVFQLERCRNLLKKGATLLHGQLSDEIVQDPTMKEVESIVKRAVGDHVSVTDPIWMANFHINSRLVRSYHVGRTFLCGDAAHIHSPAGGQGMNTGLQDAFNLAWKLGLVKKHQAPSSLLRTYHDERHAVGKHLLEATEHASDAGTLRNPLGVWLRNHMIKWMLRYAFMQKMITRAITQIAITYSKSCIIVDCEEFKKGPKAGSRAPNAHVQKNQEPIDFFTLWRKSTAHQIFVFSGSSKRSKLQPLLDHLGQEKKHYGHLIHITLVTIDDRDIHNMPYLQHVVDASHEAHTAYAAERSAVYVIRPDAYIGYRQQSLAIEPLEKYLRKIFVY